MSCQGFSHFWGWNVDKGRKEEFERRKEESPREEMREGGQGRKSA